MNRRTLISLVLTAGYWVAALCLVGLRLHGIVMWPWLWILCPLWLPLLLLGVACAGLATTLGNLGAALVHGHRRHLPGE